MITQMRVIVYLTLASSCIALPSRKDHAEDEVMKKGRGCRCVPDEWHGVMSSVERGVDLKRGRVDALERKILVHYSFPNRKVSMTDLLTGRRVVADYDKVYYSFIHSFILSFFHSFILSFFLCLFRSFICSLIGSFVHSLVH